MQNESFPPWVPTGVKRIAELMHISEGPFYWLLSTDKGKRVWDELDKHVAAGKAVSIVDQYDTIKDFSLTEQDGFDQQNQAQALFFRGIIQMLNSAAFSITQEKSQRWSEYYSSTAVSLKEMQHGPFVDDEIRKAMALVASYCVSQAERVKFDKEPRLIKSTTGSEATDRIRSSIKELALLAHRLYGNYFYTTLMNIANYTFQPERKVSRDQIINWCNELEDQGLVHNARRVVKQRISRTTVVTK